MEQQRKTTQELFDEITDRLILSLKDNEIPCPTCRGLRFIYRQNGSHGCVEGCGDCYNGKQYVCKYCGKSNKTDYCECKDAEKERRIQENKERNEEEQKLLKKAKKIKFEDYKGKFILDDSSFVTDADGVWEWLHEKIQYEGVTDEQLPKYLWGTCPEPVFDLNLCEIIEDKCENGYEDMYSYLNVDDEDLDKAQEHLDKWYEKQGDSVNIYYQDATIAVLLDDLIKEIRKEVRKEDFYSVFIEGCDPVVTIKNKILN